MILTGNSRITRDRLIVLERSPKHIEKKTKKPTIEEEAAGPFSFFFIFFVWNTTRRRIDGPTSNLSPYRRPLENWRLLSSSAGGL